MYPEESMEDSNFESYAVMYDSHRDELFILNYASGGTTYADIAESQNPGWIHIGYVSAQDIVMNGACYLAEEYKLRKGGFYALCDTSDT